jgi:hypothetical protein
MARMALNHIVANNRAAKWAVRRLYHPKKNTGGHSAPIKQNQD